MKRSKRSPRVYSRKGGQSVGYSKPPMRTRWKPGQSGNPSGRRKAVKTAAQAIDEALMRKVTIVEGNRRIRLTMQEVILRKLTYAAAGGNMNAAKTLFGFKDRYQDSNETTLDPTELDPNDQAIIQDYLEKIQKVADAPDGQADTEEVTDQSAEVGDIAIFPPSRKRSPE